jgi:microcystin-dependent protein
MGQTGGTETVTLTVDQMPGHMHAFNATTTVATAGGQTPGSGVVTATPSSNGTFYTLDDGTQPPPTKNTLPATSISQAGNNMPHENLMPILCVTYIIALTGIFPSRN